MKKSIFLLTAVFYLGNIFSQEWMQKIHDPNANFYHIQKDFNNYWSVRDNTEKGKGYKAFKRWENFV